VVVPRPLMEPEQLSGSKILAHDWDDFHCGHLVIATKHLSEEQLQALLLEMADYVGLQFGP
jgi:hypothetical protein